MIADPVAEILRGMAATLEGAAGMYDPDPLRGQIEDDYVRWLTSLFPRAYANHRGDPVPLSDAHKQFWAHIWRISHNETPTPIGLYLPRGGGKSTNAEMTPIALGARNLCRYCLYVSGTQDQADRHVGSIMSRLESDRLNATYPLMGQRRLSRYGSSRGWRRNRLSTAQGLTIDAIGLDVLASRGIKMDDDRPDLIVFDDVDAKGDSVATVNKKLETITYTILPAAATWCVVVFVQNIIHYQSIAARLAGVSTERADFMHRRVTIGPFPALANFTWDVDEETGQPTIVTGEPYWPGQGLDECQALIDLIGIRAFRAEAQHEDIQFGGGIFEKARFRHIDANDVPDLDRIEVWVDPAVSDTDLSDAHGVHADGRAGSPKDGTIYRLYSWEQRASPEAALKKAFHVCLMLRGSAIGVETDQGGDLWHTAYAVAWRDLKESGELDEWCADFGLDPDTVHRPPFKWAKAGSVGSKAHRGNMMLRDYEQGKRIYHVVGPTTATLENGLRRFLARKPYDLADASFWSWYSLRGYKTNDEKGIIPGPLAQSTVSNSPWISARANHEAAQRKETHPLATPPTIKERNARRKLAALLGPSQPL